MNPPRSHPSASPEAGRSPALPGGGSFRNRNPETARLEGFSNAVFAFAVTLLVVSTEVPRTFEGLAATMQGFFPFAFCFGILMMIWYFHYQFFRRYGLADGVTFVLNALLLFVVLFYVYPLKFMGTLLAFIFSGRRPIITLPTGEAAWMLESAELPDLFFVYSGGYLVIFLLFAALYAHALRRGDALGLSPFERHTTRLSIGVFLVQAGFGVASLLIASMASQRWVWLAGGIYMLVGPASGLYGWLGGRTWKQPQEAADA